MAYGIGVSHFTQDDKLKLTTLQQTLPLLDVRDQPTRMQLQVEVQNSVDLNLEYEALENFTIQYQ